MLDVYASLNESIRMSGVSNDVGGGYGCIIFAPNSAGGGGCSYFMQFEENETPTDGTETWLDFPCFVGTIFCLSLPFEYRPACPLIGTPLLSI